MTTTLDNKTIGTGSPAGAAPFDPAQPMPNATLAAVYGARLRAARDWLAGDNSAYEADPKSAIRAAVEMLRAAGVPDLLCALSAAEGHLLNAKIDLETGAPKKTAINTIEGGLRIARAALAKAATPVDDAEEQVRVIAGTQSNPKAEGG